MKYAGLFNLTFVCFAAMCLAGGGGGGQTDTPPESGCEDGIWFYTGTGWECRERQPGDGPFQDDPCPSAPADCWDPLMSGPISGTSYVVTNEAGALLPLVAYLQGGNLVVRSMPGFDVTPLEALKVLARNLGSEVLVYGDGSVGVGAMVSYPTTDDEGYVISGEELHHAAVEAGAVLRWHIIDGQSSAGDAM